MTLLRFEKGHRNAVALISAIASLVCVSAQTTTPTFDVVSIRKSDPVARGGGARTLPDGSEVITNQPIQLIFANGEAERMHEVENLPDWASERYDVTVKAPPGADRNWRAAMWRAMLADRLKFKGHVEQREKNGYVLVLARSDGRLGPNIKPSVLDCSPRPETVPASQPARFPTRQEAAARCGSLSGEGYVVSGGMDMRRLASFVSGFVGRAPVTDRTGLQGYYAVDLTYTLAPLSASSSNPIDPGAPPEPLTALQDQLGLKLQPEKITVPVLVIDHIERPSEN